MLVCKMLEICGITEAQLPKLYESWEVVGTLKAEVAAELGVSEEVKIIAGAGDNRRQQLEQQRSETAAAIFLSEHQEHSLFPVRNSE